MELKWIEEIDEELKEKFSKINLENILSLYRIDDFYLVFFSWKYGKGDLESSRNAWKVDDNFNVVWKVERYEFLHQGAFPYTGVIFHEGELLIRSYDGVYFKLDFETGKVTFIPGQRPW